MVRLTLVLAVITFVASLALGFVYERAAPKIAEQTRITDESARRTALPEAACGVFVETRFADVQGETLVYYKGYRDADTTEFVGYVVKAEGRGYSSVIKTVVGLDSAGTITGMKITEEQETPGLGSRVEEVTTTKTVLDAIREIAGRGEAERIAVDLVDEDGECRCVEVGLRDKPLCGEIEKRVVAGDTAAILNLAAETFCLKSEDSSAVFCSQALTFQIAEKVIKKLRTQVTPWFLKQFIGKSQGSLLVTTEETDQYIQAITGATISSVAVTESVRETIKRLEEAVGGFKEAAP